jgi:hypothetical protein
MLLGIPPTKKHRFKLKNQDSIRRWVGIRLRLKGNQKMTLLSTYQPQITNSTMATISFLTQQKRWYIDHQQITNPKNEDPHYIDQQICCLYQEDLIEFLQKNQDKLLIIGSSFNKHQEKDNVLENMTCKRGFWNILDKCNLQEYPTYKRSNHVLDKVYTSIPI